MKTEDIIAEVLENAGREELLRLQALITEKMAEQDSPLAEEKAASGSANLPIADRDRAWDADVAVGRIRKWAEAEDEPNAKYRQGFFWYDSDAPDNFGSYKLPYADVVDGTLTAIPRAIFAVAGALRGARAKLAIPEKDQTAIKGRVAGYYARMRKKFEDDGLVAPWKTEEKTESLHKDSGVEEAEGSGLTDEQMRARILHESEVVQEELSPVEEEQQVEPEELEFQEKLKDRFGEARAVAQTIMQALRSKNKSALSAWKDSAGVGHYVALCSAEMEDLEEETIETKAMDYSMALCRKHGFRPLLTVTHAPWARVGKTTWEMRLGRFWLEGGVFDETWLAKKTFQAIQEDRGGDLRISIAFLYLPAWRSSEGRYERLFRYASGITKNPALPITAIQVRGGVDNDD